MIFTHLIRLERKREVQKNGLVAGVAEVDIVRSKGCLIRLSTVVSLTV